LVAIPQITRERLASSAVGTPGVDTSAASISESIGRAAQSIYEPIAQMAIEKQQALDAAEANRLAANYKIAATDAFEQHKEAYAMDPVNKTDQLDSVLNDQLEGTLSQASNSRVKDLVGRMAQSERASSLSSEIVWAHNRKVGIEQEGIISTTNELANRGNAIGADSTLSFEEKNKRIADLFSSAGNVLESAKHLKFSPEKLAELEQKVPKSILSGVVYGMIDNSPAEAVAYLEHPDVKEMFTQEELKTFKSNAMASLKNFNETVQWKQTASSMVQAPELTNGVISGQVKWSELDRMPQTPLIKTLKDIALNSSPAAQMEVAQEKLKLIDDFQQLGIDGKHLTAKAAATQVIDFSHKLAQAYQRGVINRETFDQYNKDLASPLVSAVLDQHDPNMFEKVGSMIMHPVASFKNFINPAAKQKLERYQTGFNEINQYLKSQGGEDNFDQRLQYYQKFLDVASKADMQAKDFQGKPFTGARIAQAILNIGEGQLVDTPVGKKKVIGYAGPGNPILDTTDEEDQLMMLPIIEKRLRK